MDNNEFKHIVAQNIYYLRTINHLTQFELGEKLNYSDKAISKWERADGLPDAFVLRQMSELFGVSVDYIFTEHSEQDKKVETQPAKRNKRSIANIVLIAIVAVALLVFVTIGMIKGNYYWQIFIYALPVMCIANIVFSYVWFDGRFGLFNISALIWAILVTLYIAISTATNDWGYWLIFLLGIPAQIIIFFCFRIKISIKFSQKEHISKKSKKANAENSEQKTNEN